MIRKPDSNVVPPRHNLRHREALVRILTANEGLIALNMSGLRRTSAAVEAERRAIIAAMEECAYSSSLVSVCYLKTSAMVLSLNCERRQYVLIAIA